MNRVIPKVFKVITSREKSLKVLTPINNLNYHPTQQGA